MYAVVQLGSDLATLATRAARSADGKSFEITGRKMWISAGNTADIVVISAVTDPSKGAKGISLFAIEKGTAGFESAKRFGKVGKHASDTCLLTLDKCVIPAENLIGVEGEGFKYMMGNLSKERLSIAIGSVAAARRALALTLNYIHGRQMFGGVEADLQSVQQKCAVMRMEIQVATSFVDQCIAAQAADKLTAETASMAKVLATELACRVADQCLQFYGGYGYLKQNPVAKIWTDQRVTRICMWTAPLLPHLRAPA
jgi:alkylation response protein AidB-like acyl-CoA dehydrogenase